MTLAVGPAVGGVLVGHSHTEGCGYGVAGVSTFECIIFALLWRGERSDTMQFAVGGEFISSSCQNLVSVGLMTHVPHYSVLRCVKDVM